MFTSYSLNKRAPVVDGSILHIFGSNAPGVLIGIENQDSANTLVYHFETSPDGSTWSAMSLPIDNLGNTAVNFTLLSGAVQLLKINPMQSHLRLKCYGDLPVGLSITVYHPSDVSTTEVTLLET